MKTAFTTAGNDLNAPLDSRFGRTVRFLIYDTEEESYMVIDNSRNMNAMQGAGIQAARIIAGARADAVVTGHCGPKAFQVLSQAGIIVYHAEPQTIAEALEKLKNNELTALSHADVGGHW